MNLWDDNIKENFFCFEHVNKERKQLSQYILMLSSCVNYPTATFSPRLLFAETNYILKRFAYVRLQYLKLEIYFHVFLFEQL